MALSSPGRSAVTFSKLQIELGSERSVGLSGVHGRISHAA